MDKELSFRYETNSSTIGKIILFIILGILLLFGISLLAIGLLSIGANGDLLEGIKFFLPGLTIFLLASLGFLYSKISSRTKIVGAYFDIENNRYYLETKNGESGFIPFSEIDSFAMRREVVSGNKSSTTYFVVYFIKKDGAWWDIVSYGSEVAALKKLNEIQEKVKLNSTEDFNLLESEKKSELFSFSEKSDSVIFAWSEQVSFLYRVLGVLAVLSFLGSFWIITSAIGEAGAIGTYLLTAFSLLIGGLVIYSLVKSIFGYTDYEFEITKDKIIFSGIKKDKKKIFTEVPVSEIKFTQYSFNIHRSDIFNGQEIYLLNQEFAEKLAKYKKGEFGFGEIFGLLKEIMQMKKSIIKLPFPGFKSLDIILFEKKLDEELRKVNPEVK